MAAGGRVRVQIGGGRVSAPCQEHTFAGVPLLTDRVSSSPRPAKGWEASRERGQAVFDIDDRAVACPSL